MAVSGNAGHPGAAGLLNTDSRFAAERLVGSTGMLVLMNVPGEAPLRWRVP